jgi:hypothetical protein
LARSVSDRTGAGLVAAYGFKSKRIAVTRPLVGTTPYQFVSSNAAKPGSVLREFKKILHDVAEARLICISSFAAGRQRTGTIACR